MSIVSPTNSRFFAPYLLLLLLGVGLSCTGRYSETSSRCTTPDCLEDEEIPAGYCSSDLDCPTNEYCESGLCAERNPTTNPAESCRAHSDCNSGEYCNLATGLCVECLLDDHCELGEVCQSNGTCGNNDGCVSDADCNGLVCETSSGLCFQCLNNSHCQAGQSCRENSCVFDDTNSIPCATQSDCAPFGLICDNASSTCVPCTNDVQCGQGRVCNSGVCTNDSTSGGNSGGGNGDGTSGACSSRDECNGFACFLGECTPCFADAMCFDLADILSGIEMVCELSSGQCIQAECTSADDCPRPLGCWSGQCLACVMDSECRTGEICNANGECIEDNLGCTSNNECSGGQVCIGSACQNCTASSQCDTGQTCNSLGRCAENATGGGGSTTSEATLGQRCSAGVACASGLTCITMGENSFCSQACIGSGQGGGVDCPSGYACYKYSTDTFSLCLPNEMMVDSAGNALPGSPYNLQPGANCAAGNGCQTMYCESTTNECLRRCNADRDCNSGEVCYTAWIEAEAPATDFEIIDVHYCIGSNTASYQPAGGACSSGMDCDSGICGGTCSNDANQICNSAADCASGGTCSGTCKSHCRTNSDCSTADTCAAWPTTVEASGYSGWTTVCQNKLGSGTTPNGGACNTASDCTSDWCVGGICTTNCVTNSDCSGTLSGRSCQIIRIGDEANNPIYSTQFCQ